jgi:osmoprotectant transport system ATP-binding protein
MPTVGVEFAKVSYTLPVGRDGQAGRVLLHDVSLRLAAGTTTALLGRSGSGKTTLLRMVNGLVTPTSGEVLVEGRKVSAANRNMADRIKLRRGIGYVIQETGLFPHMTVERNTGLSLEMEGRPREEIARRVTQMLALVGMDFAEFRGRHPWQLSGGQRQRVGLARALALDPRVLLMDEPFGALDPMTRAEMQTMLKGLLERVGKTVLLVTHDLDEALYLAERVVFLAEGEVVADLGSTEVPGSENPHVKAYVRAVHRAVPT